MPATTSNPASNNGGFYPQRVATLPYLMTQGEFCSYTRKSTKTAEADRLKGRGCPYVKIGRAVRYRADDVMRFIEQNTMTSTADAATREV
jgi:hypothetical protein